MEPIIFPIIVGIIISSISGAIIALLNRKWKKRDERKDMVEENTETIKDIQKSIWRLNKTVLIMAKLLDDQTTRIHPELSTGLEDIASELLKETNNS
ncbi:hypothetical protein LCGC14_1195020 [marine sediment metagenome]|uniref:Uncharacterized protein n=1 Tax=marine sediment metagenome TaxID=412755 RepID=A0A0F9P132_9ZZZZ